MRLLSEKDARRLLAAAERITGLIAPIEARLAALEGSTSAQPAAQPAAPGSSADVIGIETRLARLEKVIAAIAAAGAST